MVIFDRTMLTGPAANQFINPDYLRPLSPLPSEVRDGPRRVFLRQNKFIKRRRPIKHLLFNAIRVFMAAMVGY